MKRRLLKVVVAQLVLAGLAMGFAITLRQDLANLALYQGSARLQAGDLAGAESALRRVAALGGEVAPLAYNLGVSRYRKGEFVQARQQFAAALSSRDPNLAAAARYNQGNSRFHQAERLAAGQTQAARRLFQEAISDYGKVLAQAPGATDAGGNLALARVRLAGLGNGQADAGGREKANSEKTQPAQGNGGNGPKTGSEQARSVAKAQPASANAQPGSERPDASASAGKPRHDLTQNEAERLLNEARGREKLAGMPHRGERNEPLAKPEKDW